MKKKNMISKNKERITITIEKSALLFVRNKSNELECTASEYINDTIKKEMDLNDKKAVL